MQLSSSVQLHALPSSDIQLAAAGKYGYEADYGGEVSRAAQSQEVVQRRPVAVTSLLVDGRVGQTWFGANRKMNRFFVLNLRQVINLLALSHTLARSFFQEAAVVISQQTTWHEQYSFEYAASVTQIFPKKLAEPKRFGTAATVIVAMEIAAKEIGSGFNVYDHLRILPANSFVDGLDKRWADRADQWSLKERHKPFSEILEISLRGPEESFGPAASVLKELSQGYCVTQWAAIRILEAVNGILPPDLRVGPVYESGEGEPSDWRLGTRNAAPSLRVPRFRNPA
jgi:hypothetical protein